MPKENQDGGVAPVPTEPRFTGPSLVAMLLLVVVLFVILALLAWFAADEFGLFARTTRDRALLNTAFVWIAVTGWLSLVVGCWLLVAEAQRPVSRPTVKTEGVEDVVPAVAAAFAQVRGARAALLAGVLLLAVAGWVAKDSLSETPVADRGGTARATTTTTSAP